MCTSKVSMGFELRISTVPAKRRIIELEAFETKDTVCTSKQVSMSFLSKNFYRTGYTKNSESEAFEIKDTVR